MVLPRQAEVTRKPDRVFDAVIVLGHVFFALSCKGQVGLRQKALAHTAETGGKTVLFKARLIKSTATQGDDTVFIVKIEIFYFNLSFLVVYYLLYIT